MELNKTYNFREIEDKIYKKWEEGGYFKANPHSSKKPYAIMMPPPNVTGIIHMGHVLDNTIQDILTRTKRMQGYEVLWQPGIDHAGIATQNVVEKELAKEGKTRFDLGREEFIKRVWEWKEKYGGIILKQLRKLGVSCDWSRTKFTLDPDMSRAVLTAFKILYDEGLIYRGKRIINWCPRCGTALADDEVEYKEEHSHLWYIKYPLVDGSGFIVVATTRPETYLGDTAVAVNPEDDRYKHLIGKKVRLPLVDWDRGGVPAEIPIIADEAVDMEFGTGAVKVTPAHDPVDFEIGTRHNLPRVIVMDERARMNENAGPYKGLDRYEARKKIVEDLKKAGFIEKIEDYTHSVGTCYRCHTVIEPYLSTQWFVKMKPLAEPAIKGVKEGEIKLIPEYANKIYFHWLENVRDWCISRQIWWGHRIPVYTCKDCGHVEVSVDEIKKCPKCGSNKIEQDEDVLDTWFSSWLWPLSTLGWPDETDFLKKFYPTNVLVTGWDILFFWVARMIMAGYHFKGREPFKVVYLHGIVRDEKRRKFSKSLGNSPDPLELIEKYGADGVRMGMMLITPEGQDIIFSSERMEVGRNFANKVWNAARYVLMNTENVNLKRFKDIEDELQVEDKWILTWLARTVGKVTDAIENFDFNGAAWTLYNFFWKKYCDFYLEMIKGRKDKDVALTVAIFVLDVFLRLLHPFMPFITEELYTYLPVENKKEAIIIADWPDYGKEYESDASIMEKVIKAIEAIREIRGEFGLSKKEVVFLEYTGDTVTELLDKKPYIRKLGLFEMIKGNVEEGLFSTVFYLDGKEYRVYLPQVDIEKEIAKTEKEIESLKKLIKRQEAKLNNQNFLNKAPKEVVEKEKKKYMDFKNKLEGLMKHLGRLKNA